MTTPTSGGAKTPEKSSSRIERIAGLNDKFRSHAGPAQTFVTMDLVHRGHPFLKKLLDHVKGLSAKTPEDEDEEDYERDYGSVTVNGVDVDWSIHYSDADGYGDSPDPSNPSLTMRTLSLNSA